MRLQSLVGLLGALAATSTAFSIPSYYSQRVRTSGSRIILSSIAEEAAAMDAAAAAATTQQIDNSFSEPQIAQKFKVVTCSATSCAEKRKVLGLDEFATFAAFYERIEDRIPEVAISETSCLGACKKAPCVAIEHEDYEGTVALEGMDNFEFSDRVFHRVIDEDDVDRVWDCVEHAVRVMAEQDDDEEEG